jgi:serine/threonine protein kinase
MNKPKLVKKKSQKRGKHYPFKFTNSTKAKSLLGGGFFGKIYLMTNAVDKQDYAVKHINIKKIQTILTLLKARPIPRNQTIDFIFNEAKTLAKLNHPNIVRYYNTRYTREIIYISLEVAHGGNLETAIEKKKFNEKPNIIYNIAIQIASGLFYIHSQNMLHRDIKASNILLLTDQNEMPQIKLGDFGLSCLMDGTKYQQTKNQTGQGDMFYRSPEAATGQAYDKGDDNWAFGQNFDDYVEQIIEDHCFPCDNGSYYSRLAMITKNLLNKNPVDRITCDKIVTLDQHFLPCLNVKKRSQTFDRCKSIEPTAPKFNLNEKIAFLPALDPLLKNTNTKRPHSA